MKNISNKVEEKEVKKIEKTFLNKIELKNLIQIVGEVDTKVKNSTPFVNLINKMSKMIDESE